MKHRITVIVLTLLFSCKTHGQYFKVIERKGIAGNFFFAKDLSRSYKILPLIDSSDINKMTYPIKLNGKNISDNDTLLMIGELLNFEGDKRLCYLPVRCYNAVTSQIYMGDITRYSLQVEALFLINQLFFNKPFNYSPYPIIYDRTNNSYGSIDEKLIAVAYKSYRSWYSEIKKIGFNKSKIKGIDPLKDSDVDWYR